MTVVVGYANGNKVWMGSDSAASDSSIIYDSAIPKVFRIGNILFGMAGSFRSSQLVRTRLAIPIHNPVEETDEEFLIRKVADPIAFILKEAGTDYTDKEQRFTDMVLLIGYNGSLYSLDGDYQISKYSQQYDAIGSGKYYALGAMSVLTKTKITQHPSQMIQRALNAAAEFNPFVRKPFSIEVLETTK